MKLKSFFTAALAAMLFVASPVSAMTTQKTINAWQKNTHYTVGDKVVYNGTVYECIVDHVKLSPNMKYVWKQTTEVFIPNWEKNSKYVSGEKVIYNGKTYECIVDHARLAPTVKYVWKLID